MAALILPTPQYNTGIPAASNTPADSPRKATTTSVFGRSTDALGNSDIEGHLADPLGVVHARRRGDDEPRGVTVVEREVLAAALEGQQGVRGADFSWLFFSVHADQCPIYTTGIDGPETEMKALQLQPRLDARDEALAKGVTINGLVILSDNPLPWNPEHTNPPGGLGEYYKRNVIGGPGAFVMVAENHASFGQAIIKKMIAEIARGPGVSSTFAAR